MADTKQDVLDMLRELAELTMLEEGDPQSFRVRAYESAAQAIAAQANDLGKLTVAELQKIDGIGKSTAEKIRELLETGKVTKLEALRAKHPALGRSRCCASRGWAPRRSSGCGPSWACSRSTICRQVLADHKLRDLKGFGVKSEDKLAQSLARLEEQGSLDRTPISVALPLGDPDRRPDAARCPASSTRRTAGRCAASPRRSATSTSSSRRRRPSR